MFAGLPIAAVVAIQLICYNVDRVLLARRWMPIDLLRLAFWRTVSPTASLLFAAAGFDAISNHRLIGLLWLGTAAILALLGMSRLRLAEGMKLKEVKGGEFYKRALVLAKATKTPLKRVCVVPAGKGHLTNAYGGSQAIAVTDNFGKFLTSAQLDFVIGHELEHAKGKHGRKKLLITAGTVAGIAIAAFFVPRVLTPFRALLDVPAMFGPILTFYFLSRRFEYAADAAGIELTRDPETAIHALVNLHRITAAPVCFGKFTELFMTHPPLMRRAIAIGEKGGLSSDQIFQAVGGNDPQEPVQL